MCACSFITTNFWYLSTIFSRQNRGQIYSYKLPSLQHQNLVFICTNSWCANPIFSIQYRGQSYSYKLPSLQRQNLVFICTNSWSANPIFSIQYKGQSYSYKLPTLLSQNLESNLVPLSQLGYYKQNIRVKNLQFTVSLKAAVFAYSCAVIFCFEQILILL